MGGDGTLNEVLNGIVGSPVRLGFIPGGTANVFACETGISRNPIRAAEAILRYSPVRVAAGKVSPAGAPPRHFLLMAGAGLDRAVIDKVDHGIKKSHGKVAYWLAGLSMFGARLPQMIVRVNGHSTRTGFVLVARVRNYGGDLAIAAGASLARPDFEVVTFKGKTTLPYFLYLTGALFGAVESLPGVYVTGTEVIALQGPAGQSIGMQIDGEAYGQLPATLEIVPDAVTLLVPPGSIRLRV